MKRLGLVFLLTCAVLRGAPVDYLLAAATDAELQPVLARLTDVRTEKHAAWQFWFGTLGRKTVALTRTEGDPLNAVAATTLAIRRFAPRMVVTFGSARAHDPALHPGDVVVSRSFTALDGIESPSEASGSGSNPLKWDRLLHPIISAGEIETPTAEFPAAQDVLGVAGKLSSPRGRVVTGVLSSSGGINREADRIAWLRTQWGSTAEDGESAHIAGCALLLGVPVIGLRVIDGLTGEAASVTLQWLEAAP